MSPPTPSRGDGVTGNSLQSGKKFGGERAEPLDLSSSTA